MSDIKGKSRLSVIEEELDVSDPEISAEMLSAFKKKYAEFQKGLTEWKAAEEGEGDDLLESLLDCASDLDEVIQAVEERDSEDAEAGKLVKEAAAELDEFEGAMRMRFAPKVPIQ